MKKPQQVAALYVDPAGCYAGLDGVELWNEQRDARTYPGPHPVVAHPPCGRWCKLAHAVQGRYPEMRVGDDGGTFAAALGAVRRWGGVLEHPAWTKAWKAYGLRTPWKWGGWLPTRCGGHVARVEQLYYGHPARKETWLYAHGIDYGDLPQLRWGRSRWGDGGPQPTGWVGHCTNRGRPKKSDGLKRLSSRASSMTPVGFRDALLALARSAKHTSGDRSPAPRD